MLHALTPEGEGDGGSCRRVASIASARMRRTISATGSCRPATRRSARSAAITASCRPPIRRDWERWRRIGAAQRHLFYSILRWRLPHPTREENPDGGLVFDFLADELDAGGNVVAAAMTGHEDGLISLRAAEADDVRESVRVSMGEPHRTLLGHFRHEIGHFYSKELVRDPATLGGSPPPLRRRARGLCRRPPAQPRGGPPADWQDRFISTYASCHPAEDFAECWAHFLHIVDTLETARAFGLNTDPKGHEELEHEVSDPTIAESRPTPAGSLILSPSP